MRLAPLLTIVLFTHVAGSAGASSVPMLSRYEERFDYPNTNQTWGWSFEVLSPFTVTHVGWYDVNRDGLSHSHRIGLWGSAGQLLGPGVVVPSGTVAELDGPWRKVPIPGGPISIPIGRYAVGGENHIDSTDPIKLAVGVGDPRVYIDTPVRSEEPGFQGPNYAILLGGAVWIGPMLFVNPIPEPTTSAMALLACLGAVLSRRFARYC